MPNQSTLEGTNYTMAGAQEYMLDRRHDFKHRHPRTERAAAAMRFYRSPLPRNPPEINLVWDSMSQALCDLRSLFLCSKTL